MSNNTKQVAQVEQLTIKVHRKNHFGRNDILYPSNETAQLLCNLLGKKCINTKHVPILKAMGYTVIETPEITEEREL